MSYAKVLQRYQLAQNKLMKWTGGVAR